MSTFFLKRFFTGSMIAMIVLVSSCDFLSIDGYVENDLKLDSVFAERRSLEAFMWGITEYLPYDEGAIVGNLNLLAYTPGPFATDEAFNTLPTGTFPGMAFVLGEIDANNPGVFVTNYRNWYRAIRQANMVLARMRECNDCLTADFNRIRGYALFLRAYAYYHLLMNFGPFVIIGDEVIANNESLDYYNRPRDLYDTCMEYLCRQFEAAALLLPVRNPNHVLDFGRPTRGAAYALIARLRLQHASELYNGGVAARAYFGNWRRSTDDSLYIQQEYDPKRWEVAAAAAKRVIDMRDARGKLYNLHTVNLPPDYVLYWDEPEDLDEDERKQLWEEKLETNGLSRNTRDEFYLRPWKPDPWADGELGGAVGICPYQSYQNMFSGDSEMTGISEFIWARRSSALMIMTRYSFPLQNQGDNAFSVPQKIVDAYEMADGNRIDESSQEFPYFASGFTEKRLQPFLDYSLNLNISRMYVNREPRFYASIGFSQAIWPNRSTTNLGQRNMTVTYYEDSSDGLMGASNSNPNHYPITGYVLKKWVSNNDAWNGEGGIRLSKPYPIIRYAEILLAYAEAMNNIDGAVVTLYVDGEPQTLNRSEEIRKAFNLVRYRAGLPGLDNAELENPGIVMQRIKRERMVEFLWEGQRYFDVRRWGDYEASELEPIMGMNTAALRAGYYQKVIVPSVRVSQRVVDRRMVFLPIPQDEIRRLPSFDQNPGW